MASESTKVQPKSLADDVLKNVHFESKSVSKQSLMNSTKYKHSNDSVRKDMETFKKNAATFFDSFSPDLIIKIVRFFDDQINVCKAGDSLNEDGIRPLDDQLNILEVSVNVYSQLKALHITALNMKTILKYMKDCYPTIEDLNPSYGRASDLFPSFIYKLHCFAEQHVLVDQENKLNTFLDQHREIFVCIKQIMKHERYMMTKSPLNDWLDDPTELQAMNVNHGELLNK